MFWLVIPWIIYSRMSDEIVVTPVWIHWRTNITSGKVLLNNKKKSLFVRDEKSKRGTRIIAIDTQIKMDTFERRWLNWLKVANQVCLHKIKQSFNLLQDFPKKEEENWRMTKFFSGKFNARIILSNKVETLGLSFW